MQSYKKKSTFQQICSDLSFYKIKEKAQKEKTPKLIDVFSKTNNPKGLAF